MGEAEVKAELRGLLDVTGNDFDAIWQFLERGYYEELFMALAEPETAASDLKALVEDRGVLDLARSVGGRSKPQGRGRAETVEVALAEHEQKYVEFLCWYLAERAEELDEVRRFRKQELGGGTLTKEQALERLRHEELESQGFPTDADAMSDEELEAASDVIGMDKHQLLSARVPSMAAGVAPYEDPVFPRAKHLKLLDWWLDKRRNTSRRVRPRWDSGDQQSGRGMSPTKRSNLDELGKWLATLFPWRPTDAVWFVLTGEPPEVIGIELSYDHQRNLFTLIFAPWVSEKTLQRAYRGGRQHLSMGGYRPLEERTVEMLRFVYENFDRSTDKPVPWTRLMDLWNQRRPGKRFGTREAFRQACLRADEWLGIRELQRQGKKE